MRAFLVSMACLITIVLFCGWFLFYKGEPLKNARMVTICLDKNKLHIATAESAKIFTGCEGEVTGDTLKVTIKTALVNTFVKQPEISGELDVPSNIRFVVIADKVISLNRVITCKR